MEPRTSSLDCLKRQFRIDGKYILALLLLGGIVYFPTMRPGHDWGGDFSMYIIEARNIALGHPYTQSGYLIDPELPLLAPPSYPPMFPVLLAPVYRLFGLNYFAFKVLVQVLLLFAWLPYYILARQRGLSPLASFFITLAFGLSALMLLIKESILAEGTYLLIAGIGLLAIEWIYQQGWDETRPVQGSVVVAAVLLLAYACRTTGLTLAIAWGVYEICHVRRVRRFGVLVVSGFTAMLIVYTVAIYDGRGYGNQFAVVSAVYLENVTFYLHAPAALWGGCPPLLRYPVAGVVLPLTVFGWVRSLRRPTVTEFYFVASVGVVLVYSAGRNTRYLLPIFPILLIYTTESISWLAEKYLRQYQRPAMAGWFAILTLGVVLNVRAMDKGPITDGPETPDFLQTCAFIKNNTPANTVVAFWNPRVLCLYTNRMAAWYVHTADDARFARYLSRIHASYVVSYRGSEDNELWLRPHLQRMRSHFQPVYENKEFQVYKVLP